MTLSENGKVLGFLNFWELSDFVYLEHFAVDKNLRGKGLGSELIRKLSEICAGKTIVLEAEPPELNEFSSRRIEFYRRLGFVSTQPEQITDGLRYTPMRFEK